MHFYPNAQRERGIFSNHRFALAFELHDREFCAYWYIEKYPLCEVGEDCNLDYRNFEAELQAPIITGDVSLNPSILTTFNSNLGGNDV